jgi:predicted Ser/Thr protein kinase
MSVQEGLLPPRYEDVKRIGHGGMGDIFAAQDGDLGRRVAVKILAERYSSDPSLRRRFKREALAAARLSGHPHIVTIYDVGEWEDRPFIVMELLTGGTLGERAREGHVAHEEALAWLEQAAEAVDAAHAEGIVHRDVKPANLIFDARGDLHVVDFGIARVLDESTGAGMTQTGMVLGTSGYLSPEQARGEQATQASDIYSLGVVAFELLAGGRPFERSSTTAEAAAHIHEPVPSASAQGVGLPRAVDQVFERALAKDPRDRPRTARDLVHELRAVLAPAAAPAPAATAATVAAEPARVRRARSSFPVWVVPLVALLLAGGALAAVLATRDGGADAQAVTRADVVTRTQGGETVTKTVVETVVQTAPAPAPAPTTEQQATTATPATTAAAPVSGGGHSLNDRGYSLMQQGSYEAALPLLQSAVQQLRGAGPSDPYEAYANYNLGYVLVKLGRCDEAMAHLDRSEQLQGSRAPITAAKQAAQAC